MDKNNNLNNNNPSNDDVKAIKAQINQYLIKKGYDPNVQIKKLPPVKSIYANDYAKANYFPPDLVFDNSGFIPSKHKFMPSIIAKRGYFPKWDYKAKARFPGIVNSLLMWPGKYFMTSVVCAVGFLLVGLIMMIAAFCTI